MKNLHNKNTEELQKIDSAHYLHPFTDYKDLNNTGTRVIISGKGNYVMYYLHSCYRSFGNMLIACIVCKPSCYKTDPINHNK